MQYQNARVNKTRTTKKAIAPEGKNFSLFWGDSIIVDFSGTNLPGRPALTSDLYQGRI